MKKNKFVWKKFIKGVAVVVFLLLVLGFVMVVDMIKVGVLYLLFGMMVISEIILKDIVLMLIEEQNKKGGLMGKKLEVVVVDFVFNWLLFVEKVKEFLEKEKVDVIFGCWILVLCKFVFLVIEELNGMLFYLV